MNILKKIILTSSIITAVSAISANAAVIEFKLNDVNFATEKEGVVTKSISEAAPYVSDTGRTMVPIRAISDAFGAKTTWIGETQEVLVESGEKTVKLQVGNAVASVNGETAMLDSVPVIVNDRTFVPLRFIGEAFGYNVNYVSSTANIVIDDTPIVFEGENSKITFAEFKTLYDISYQANAMFKEQMPEEEYKMNVFTLAKSNAESIAHLYDAFSEVGFLASDAENVKTMISEDGQNISIPMEGLKSLVYEKFYFASGTPAIADKIANKGEEIKTAYENSYVRAKHILVEDEALAKEIYDKLLKGEDFDTLMEVHGIDPGAKANPNGYVFTYGEMVSEFETASFNLEVGKISEPVETAYGYHIIKREALPQIQEDQMYAIATLMLSEEISKTNSPAILLTDEQLLDMLK